MSSPSPPPSPLSEALANEDIAFSSPDALRALPIGSSWPPRSASEAVSPPREEKRRSKLLPGEKDPQPAFRKPTEESLKVGAPSRRHKADWEKATKFSPVSQLSLIESSSAGAGPSRRQNVAALRSLPEPSSAVAGLFRRHNAAVAAGAEKSKQLSPASGREKSHIVITNHGQNTAQGDVQAASAEIVKRTCTETMDSTTSRCSIDLRPLHRGSSWPDSQPPSSPSSSGSWVTARGEDFQVDKEGEKSPEKMEKSKCGVV